MNSPDASPVPPPVVTLTSTTGSNNTMTPEGFDAHRRRASSLEADDFPTRTMHRSKSAGWLQSFNRRASVDFTENTMSPAGSFENLSGNFDTRSGHSSGDVTPTGAEQSSGLAASQDKPTDRRDTVPLWKWKLFGFPQEDDLRRRRIIEGEEGDVSMDGIPPSGEQTTITPPNNSILPSFSILRLARNMSARDLNAITPCGDL